MYKSSAFLAFLLLAAPDVAAERVEYLRDVKPILTRKCIACHGALKQKGGLRLDAAGLIAKGGTSGPILVPGKPEESSLIDAVTGGAGIERMPLDGEPLTDGEIALLKAWVEQGAQAPDEAVPLDPRQHWAFQKPERTAVPAVQNQQWVRNPLDAFVAAEHERQGLTPRPSADKTILLRRVYLDLIGLPPTRAEIQEYLDDSSPDAYEQVVKRLLDSPHYGERWGRHWMDVWRYSDWDGFGPEVRESKPHIWRWRDWIIQSLNADRPYSEMVVEMLAGDEVAPEDPNTVRATGFLVRNWYVFNRNVWLDNSVEHTAKAFLGMTFNCARCHDHMYDPISQADYYRFRAFFEPHNIRTDGVPGQIDTKQDGCVRIYDADANASTFLFTRGDEKQPVKDHPLTPGLPASLAAGDLKIEPVALSPAAYYPGSRPFAQHDALAQSRLDVKRSENALAKAVESLASTKQKAAEVAGASANPVAGFLGDDFAIAKPDVWKTGRGEWEFKEGHLTQKDPLDELCQLTSVAPHPADFVAKFRFKITGGKKWKSVGLSFDCVEDREFRSAYLSANAPGPKLQFFRRREGQDAYPPEGARALPVELNRDYELQVSARGPLVNVALNGKLLLAERLPESRPPEGRFAVWTYDATAEFLKVSVDALAPNVQLAEAAAVDPKAAAAPPAIDPEIAVKEATSALAVAEKALAVSQASAAALAARIAADSAKFAVPPGANAKELALSAGRADRELTLRQAEQHVLLAEQQLTVAKQASNPDDEAVKTKIAEAETKLAEAQKAHEAAQAALDAPSENYKPLGDVYPATSTGRRRALANWIVSAQNPLAARVAVNHIWLRHFGSPLVPTVFDFGVNGKPPTHPALLDWLATELMEQGWKTKRIHYLIVTSNTYRLQSASKGGDERNAAIDPENRFLWRANVRRMEAEIVRDSTLCVAGQLDRTLYGAELDPDSGLTATRRSIYFRSSKEKKMSFLTLFDSPNVVECYRRTESIAPQQALAMANSGLTLAQARLLARTLSNEDGAEGASPNGNGAAFIIRAFRQILCRAPTAAEQHECENFLAEQTRLLGESQTLTPFTAGVETPVKPSTDPQLRAREDLVHVLLNHNDFLTVR